MIVSELRSQLKRNQSRYNYRDTLVRHFSGMLMVLISFCSAYTDSIYRWTNIVKGLLKGMYTDYRALLSINVNLLQVIPSRLNLLYSEESRLVDLISLVQCQARSKD